MKNSFSTAIASVVSIFILHQNEAMSENSFQRSCIVELSKRAELEKFTIQKVEFIDSRLERIKEDVIVPPIVSFESAIDAISKYRRPTDAEITKLYENNNGYERERIVREALYDFALHAEYHHARLKVSTTYAGHKISFDSNCSITKGVVSVGPIKLDP